MFTILSRRSGSRRGRPRLPVLGRCAALVAGAALALAAAPSTASAATGGSWGTAIEVPGLGTLDGGIAGFVEATSCASSGYCAAVGTYVDSGRDQGYVVSERNGVWGTAIEMPAAGTLNAGGDAQVASVSCGSAGNCEAGGDYLDSAGHSQAFVVAERHGTWHQATEIPGTGTLNAGGAAKVDSITCPLAGNCEAIGTYEDGPGHTQAFVATERHGRWHPAIEISGTLNSGDSIANLSVSCAALGSCVAGGESAEGLFGFQGIVAVQRHGRWHQAVQVPGLAKLHNGGGSGVETMACAPAGPCVAAGFYITNGGHSKVFVVTEAHGRWGRAAPLPGLAALHAGGSAALISMTCPVAGNCEAGGTYTDAAGNVHAFVISERHHRWRQAIDVAAPESPDVKSDTEIVSVSCAAAGHCAAGGHYTDRSGDNQAFVLDEDHGTWGKAIELPGSGALNVDHNARLTSIACAPAGTCVAGGSYTPSFGTQAFVDSQIP